MSIIEIIAKTKCGYEIYTSVSEKDIGKRFLKTPNGMFEIIKWVKVNE